MKHGSKLYRLLDRRGVRATLPVVASAGISIKHEPCWVSRRGDVWVHRYRQGRFAAPMPGSPTLTEQLAKTRRLYLQDYEPAPGDTIVDVGAGLGTEMLAFAQAVEPGGRVVAIEAHPRTHRFLRINQRLNDLEVVQPLQAAVGDKPGTAWLSDYDTHLTNSMVTATDDNHVEVPVTTLDDVLDRFGLERVDLLKMNIEGAEAAALRGATRMLARTRHVYVSCHDFVADHADDRDLSAMRTFDEVCEILSAAGFALSFPAEDTGLHDVVSIRDAVWAKRPGGD